MPPKILLFTNSEHGQANVFLAVAYELAIQNVEVHIASFLPFEKRLPYLQHLLQEFKKEVTFHHIPMISYKDALGRTVDMTELCHPPGVEGALQSYRYMFYCLYPWTAEEYHQQLLSIQRIVEEVNPTGIVIDSLLNGALDVCKQLNRKFAILSPNSPKDYLAMTQPRLQGLWKYPVISSGYPFPVPVHLIPANIYLNLRIIFELVTSPLAKSLDNMRRQLHGLTSSCINQITPEIPFLFPALPQTEFKGFQFPLNVHLCGPILLPTVPIQESMSDLKTWLNGGGMKTVLVNLGTHAMSNPDHIRQLGGGIRILLNAKKDIQVLWKVIASGEIEEALQEVVDPKRMKVVSWLDTEPSAILLHPNVVCSVHHGGANSFFEAVSAGVPQVILPKWYDTYDYARRAECLGIGIYGSATSAPAANADEFGQALLKVATDETYAINSKMLAQQCGTGKTGRVMAAEKILGLLA